MRTEQVSPSGSVKVSLRGAAKVAVTNTNATIEEPVSILINKIHMHVQRIDEGMELAKQVDEMTTSDAKAEKFEAFKQSAENVAAWRKLFGEDLPLDMEKVQMKIDEFVAEESTAFQVLSQEANELRAEKRTRISKAEKLAEAMKLVEVMDQNIACEKLDELKKDSEMVEFWQNLFGEDLTKASRTVAEMRTMVADFIAKEQAAHDQIQKTLEHLEL